MSNHIPLPRTTASFKLFFATIALIGVVSFGYFSWYSPALEIPEEMKGKTIILVAPEDDLNTKIKEASENSILLIAPSRREENIRIVGKSGITLKSEGRVFIWSLKGSTIVMENSKNCTIENLVLQTKSESEPVLLVSQCEDIFLHNNTLLSTLKGIQIQNKSNKVTVEKNTFRCAEKAFNVQQSNNIYIRKNIIDCTSETGNAIHFNEVKQFSLEENTLNAYKGIFLNTSSAQDGFVSSIFRNKIDTKLEAFEIVKSTKISLTSNEIASEKKDAIYLQNCENIEIGRSPVVANKIKAENGSALRVAGGKEIQISYNFLHNRSKQRAALEIESTQSMSIVGNEITGRIHSEEGSNLIIDSQGGGIYLKDNSAITCDKNIVKESEKGILIEICPSVTLKGNEISNNQGRGIQSENSTVNIENNKITENAVGIWMIQSKGQINDNILTDNRGYGIYLDQSSPDITVNKIKSNNRGGIYCTIKSAPQKISGNQFLKNNGYAIESEKRFTFEGDNFFQDNVGQINW